jgi:hypothetical protein
MKYNKEAEENGLLQAAHNSIRNLSRSDMVKKVFTLWMVDVLHDSGSQRPLFFPPSSKNKRAIAIAKQTGIRPAKKAMIFTA